MEAPAPLLQSGKWQSTSININANGCCLAEKKEKEMKQVAPSNELQCNKRVVAAALPSSWWNREIVIISVCNMSLSISLSFFL